MEDELVEALHLLPENWEISIQAVHGGYFVQVSEPGPRKVVGRKVYRTDNIKFQGTLSSLDNLPHMLNEIY